MSRSIIGSVAGHIQVYNAEVQGRAGDVADRWADPDLSPMTDCERTPGLLEKVPNVKSVVPMGISGALVTSGNTIDLALEKLRNVVREEKEQGARREREAQPRRAKEHVRQIVRCCRAI